jgi:hypothetical protein
MLRQEPFSPHGTGEGRTQREVGSPERGTGNVDRQAAFRGGGSYDPSNSAGSAEIGFSSSASERISAPRLGVFDRLCSNQPFIITAVVLLLAVHARMLAYSATKHSPTMLEPSILVGRVEPLGVRAV